MKKILPLIALVILIATACKKDKNEPDPVPENTTNQMVQALDGKNIEIYDSWSRDTGSITFEVFHGIGSVSDSFSQTGNFEFINQFSDWSQQVSQGSIKVISNSVIEFNGVLLQDNSNIQLQYILTNANDNQDYLIFSYLNNYPYGEDSTKKYLKSSYSPNNSIDYALGNTNNFNDSAINKLRAVDVFVGLFGVQQLYIPKNASTHDPFIVAASENFHAFDGTYEYVGFYKDSSYTIVDTFKVNRMGIPSSVFNRFHGGGWLFSSNFTAYYAKGRYK